MLKFLIDHDNREYKIVFDVPVIAEIARREEFTILLENLSAKDRCRTKTNGDGEMTQIAGRFDTLLEAADNTLSPEESEIQCQILMGLFGSGESDLKNGLQVNFHQKPFDTPLRYWQFILNQGHFTEYFFNRINWHAAPQNKYVTPFPLHVDIESASTCNMNCPMCYRDQLKETGQMAFDVFKKAVDECARHKVFSIRLSWRGETLTHPRIQEMIAYATGKIKNVSFLTNAFYLNEDAIAGLITNKVSYVAVSFDGIGEVYESIRHPAKFQENYHKLENLCKKRDTAGGKLPQVRLCTIWPAIKEDPDAYYRTMRTVSDYMVYNPYINFKGPMKIKPDFICQYPWERIVIGFNGDAQCCTGWNADDIILGNIAEKSIAQMWHSRRMAHIRNLHQNGKRLTLNSCANCRHGSKGDPDINIREVIQRRY